jgi:hypothetical protein
MKDCHKVKIVCMKCSDVIGPDGNGSVIWCSCKSCALDGKYDESGEGYCRILGNFEDYIQLK